MIPDNGKRWDAFRVRLEPPAEKARIRLHEGEDENGLLCQEGFISKRGPELAIFLSKPRVINDIPQDQIQPGKFFIHVTVFEKDGKETEASKVIEVE